MPEAQLNPATLNLIRNQAYVRSVTDIAGELGWSEERVRRVARERCGFELPATGAVASLQAFPTLNPCPPLVPADPPKPAQRAAPDRRVTRVGQEKRPLPKIRSDMTLPEIADVLPRRQAQVLRALAGFMDTTTSHVTSYQLVGLIGEGLHFTSVASIARAIDHYLRKTRWTIESGKGKHGGYRLVERP